MTTTKRRVAALLIATLFAAAGATTALSASPAIDDAHAAGVDEIEFESDAYAPPRGKAE